MAYRAALLTALAVGVAPCAAQGIMVPAPVAPPALPASPLPSPSASVPAPALPSLHDDLLKDLPALPDLDSISPQIAAWVRMRGAGLARGGEIPEAEEMQAYIRKAGYGILGGGRTSMRSSSMSCLRRQRVLKRISSRTWQSSRRSTVPSKNQGSWSIKSTMTVGDKR